VAAAAAAVNARKVASQVIVEVEARQEAKAVAIAPVAAVFVAVVESFNVLMDRDSLMQRLDCQGAAFCLEK
jgi:hypothetical protein